MNEDMGGNAILQVRGLCFGYDGRPLFSHWGADVLPGVSLVLGGDGAGKTTLLRLLAGVQPVQAGRLMLNGADAQAQTQAYRAQVCWMEPRSAGLDALAPQAWFAQLPARHPRWSAEALQAHIEGFGLAPHLHKPMHQLSTGSQRKVLLAAGLASGAALTLLDEPVAGLDKPSILHLQRALADEAQRGGRAIVVAHYDRLAGVPWRDIFELPD